ncbi:hypothetical protein ACEPPN_003870 [Leptodophora sp. 'Broadleaf-Isolate-01']
MFGSNSRPGGSGSGSGDQRRNQPKPPSSGPMKEWGYVDENGNDVTDEYAGPTPARSRRARAMASRESTARARGPRRNEDILIGGTDESSEPYPQGSMNDPLPNARVRRPPVSLSFAPPAPPPIIAAPIIAGLPLPSQSFQLLSVPRRADGRLDRRLLNPNPSMWWNQTGQERTSPSSDSCYECVVKHTKCDVLATSYPCTSCQEKDLICRNGLPSQRWELEFIESQTNAQVPGGMNPGPPANMNTNRSRRPESAANRPRRPEKRDTPKLRRRRSASPRRDEGDDGESVDFDDGKEDDEDEVDEVSTPKPTGRGNGRPKSYKRTTGPRSPPKKVIPDKVYEKKYGMKRKCQHCTGQKLTCTGGRPCDRCRRTGRECVSMDSVPYTVQPPPPPSGNEVNDDDDEEDDDGGDGRGADSDRPPGRRTRSRKQKGKQRAQPDPDPDQHGGMEVDVNPLVIPDEFNGLQNPYHYLRHDMQAIGRGVPRARLEPLAIPVPTWWHNTRNTRVRRERGWMEGAGGYRGAGFGGVDESANRPVWDQKVAQSTWYTNATPQGLQDLIVRENPVPYTVNRPYNSLPDFGQNMIDQIQSVDAQVPPPPIGDQIPWIATWNFDEQRPEQRLVQTRGPLGWPYPTINSLTPNHQHNTDGFADATECCENENHFAGMFDPYSACHVNPARQCEVLPDYDGDHQRNPWHTCNVCRLKQWNHHAASERSTLMQQKLYTCEICAQLVRREGRSWPRECLCHASKTCRDLCHLHKEQIENAAIGPILIAEDWLIRSEILQQEKDMCINCGFRDANQFSNVWACKLCREWVQDTSEPLIDNRRQ